MARVKDKGCEHFFPESEETQKGHTRQTPQGTRFKKTVKTEFRSIYQDQSENITIFFPSGRNEGNHVHRSNWTIPGNVDKWTQICHDYDQNRFERNYIRTDAK